MSVTRRTFLITSAAAGAGLLLRVEAQAGKGVLAPNAFLGIGADGTVTVWVTRSEMGQGVRTSLPMLVAEELDAEWSRVVIRQAELDARFGQQRTGGSLSVRELWEPLRRAGATARAMLVTAAAMRWEVPAARLSTENGVVSDPLTGRRAAYGDLVAVAATLPVPDDVELKAADRYRIIGTSKRRLDGPDIVTGRARFGIDVRVPGMLHATFVRSPVPGGKVRRLNAGKAKGIAGVRHIVPVDGTGLSWLLQWSRGVAVVADSTWAALRGRDALEIEWDEGVNAALEQETIEDDLLRLAAEPGLVVRRDGEAPVADEAGAVTADYMVPYLAHAPLEPMNCVVAVSDDRCRVWAPVQLPEGARAIAARAAGIEPERVDVEVTLLGGGFGRRLYADYVGEAALISKAVGAPVQLLWTREDDMRHGFYRPISHHRMAARIHEQKVVCWSHRITGPSRRTVAGRDAKQPEESESYAAIEMPYDIAAVNVEFNHLYVPIPCGPWRSVAYSQTGFVIESFIDELAHAAGADPVAFRLAHLMRKPFLDYDGEKEIDPARLRRVLTIAAQRAGKAPRRPLGRGFAVTFDHGAAVAHAADVSAAGDRIRVHRFVTAIDCGTVVNPDHVRAQVEGGIVFGLSAALKGEITIRRGRVEQGNYNDYDVLRMDEMPRVEVHIIPSREAPGGVGEPPVPGVAPAVANAIFAATGKRLRRLPFRYRHR
ncbi:MAG TPA: xanthine dehydrogenase family protein molybdopterin-binding subunit [Thermoanaerobaculia bacterium]|nr:xanthine dehydrogenase family protein molybdopterin-binding subunit [Thermoanaerobaculia bacterium]